MWWRFVSKSWLAGDQQLFIYPILPIDFSSRAEIVGEADSSVARQSDYVKWSAYGDYWGCYSVRLVESFGLLSWLPKWVQSFWCVLVLYYSYLPKFGVRSRYLGQLSVRELQGQSALFSYIFLPGSWQSLYPHRSMEVFIQTIMPVLVKLPMPNAQFCQQLCAREVCFYDSAQQPCHRAAIEALSQHGFYRDGQLCQHNGYICQSYVRVLPC